MSREPLPEHWDKFMAVIERDHVLVAHKPSVAVLKRFYEIWKTSREPAPEHWEKFKAFVTQDDVLVAHKPLLPVLLRFYEAGFKREIPAELLPLKQLFDLRQHPAYAAIMAAEEQCGKYAGIRKREATEPAAEVVKKIKKNNNNYSSKG